MGRTDILLRKAQRLINSRIGAVLRASDPWRSRPWGFVSDSVFYDQALEVDTDLSPEALLDEVQIIERMLGRDRQLEAAIKKETGQKYASRIMDVDIIFYDDLVMETPLLTIPHPLMHMREFVLAPMSQIAPTLVHPVLGLSVEELLEKLRSERDAEQ